MLAGTHTSETARDKYEAMGEWLLAAENLKCLDKKTPHITLRATVLCTLLLSWKATLLCTLLLS